MDDIVERQPGSGNIVELTAQLRDLYAAFGQNLSALSRGDNAGQAFGNQLRSWIGAGGYKQQAEKVCADFGTAVKEQIEKLCTALKTAPEEEAQAACAKAAEIMLLPIPFHASDTKSLMLRAAAPSIAPLLNWFDRETLLRRYEEFQNAYPKKARLPAEKTFLREMEQQLKRMDSFTGA